MDWPLHSDVACWCCLYTTLSPSMGLHWHKTFSMCVVVPHRGWWTFTLCALSNSKWLCIFLDWCQMIFYRRIWWAPTWIFNICQKPLFGLPFQYHSRTIWLGGLLTNFRPNALIHGTIVERRSSTTTVHTSQCCWGRTRLVTCMNVSTSFYQPT